MDTNVREKEYKYCPTCKNELKRKPINRENLLSCSKCNFVFWNNPRPVVSILLPKGGKVLMVQRNQEPLKDYWVLPGGYVQYLEKPEETTKREVKEETSQEITIDGLIGVYQIDNDPRGMNLDIIYYGKSNGDIKLSDEDKRWRYFEIDKLPEKIAYKHREAINDWANKCKR
jgi:ADP-ribose pyrophosphatase YjhB (NUDIX family)